MGGAEAVFAGVFAILMVGGLVVVGWVLPITLGLRCARRKNYSTAWMLFGIHPVGGWIAYIVLSCLKGRTQCTRCGAFLAVHWRVCPYCQTPMPTQGYPTWTPPQQPPPAWTPPPQPPAAWTPPQQPPAAPLK